jgi:uncharacterized protein YjbI with pentapeptide repeats
MAPWWQATAEGSNLILDSAPTLESPLLAERLATALPGERAGLLLAAVAAGEPLALAGADLRGIDLRAGRPARRGGTAEPAVGPSPVVLDGADLSGATLSGACLAHVSLRGARLEGALLVGADLRSADLAGASLANANLAGADLSRADLSFANLRGASFLTANLSEITATGADLRETVLHAASLPRAILRGADLRWAHLDGANLSGAVLDGARFEGATLTLTNLSGAQLSPATNFSYAFLHQARLDRTGLTRAHLGSGIGEAYTDLLLAEGTYRALTRAFEAEGRISDARWAGCEALAMATASHRPDVCRRYHARSTRRLSTLPSSARLRPEPVERALFLPRHTSRWLTGKAVEVTTGYGSSLSRVALTLAVTWLLFAFAYGQLGLVMDVSGRAVTTLGLLGYSAAALTPVDAFPLEAADALGRGLSLIEGVLGIVLLGALGFVGLARLRG